ncbi:MAG: hypothetical protein A3G93_09990 [Nitrospinae bacterium RIFCSPLOWO2_12_FULL_45_22]|nr:MAG: hypothetical protein A3G93_09990 [Nitrospinae bacterium RIFCSPLOWO2_12_FULL_45_22]
MAKDFDRTPFIKKFVEETRERLRRVEHDFISLEAEKGNRDILQGVLREVHTIKGSANMLGLKNISTLAHSIEAMLDKEKGGEEGLNPQGMNILYQSIDLLSRMVEVIAQDGKETLDPSDLCASLESAISAEKMQPALPPNEMTPTSTYHYLQISDLETVRINASIIEQLSKISSELRYWIMREEERYHQLSNLLSPIFQGLPQELRTSYKKFLENYSEEVVLGDRLIHQLQEEVLAISLIPLAHVFDGLPRAVRDLSQELGKEVELVIEGGEIAIDQRIINQIDAPLIHLVRNAIDHGIEHPEQRRLLGKPPKGKLRVCASQKGNRISIEIEDDGQGIDFPKIQDEIVKKGFLSQEEAASLPEGELLRFIFNPGFTTQSIITEVSGRGIGLDIVRGTVEKLNGTVTLTTERGNGTRCLLNLPFYLALIPSLLFTSGDSTFAIPLSFIEEVVYLDPNKVMSLENRDVISFHGKTIPAAKLTGLLQLPTVQGDGQKYYALIIKHGEQRVGILADKVLEEKDIVIKKLGRYFRATREISGVAGLSNGGVALALNVTAIVEAIIQGLRKGIPLERGKIEETKKGPLSLLLAEDSLIVRDLEKNILQMAGYKVETARDGLEALEKLKEQDFDLIITDIEMPRMNGFELVAAVRKDDRHKEIPIIIVTTKEKREDRLRGLEVGADAYMLKSSFDQGEFLAIIEKLAKR